MLLITLNLGLICLVVWLSRDRSPDVWTLAYVSVLGINAGMSIPTLYFAYMSDESEWFEGVPTRQPRKP